MPNTTVLKPDEELRTALFCLCVLLSLLFQLVFNFLRLIILYQSQDVLVGHHTLNEFSLRDFIWKERGDEKSQCYGWKCLNVNVFNVFKRI